MEGGMPFRGDGDERMSEMDHVLKTNKRGGGERERERERERRCVGVASDAQSLEKIRGRGPVKGMNMGKLYLLKVFSLGVEVELSCLN
jgi:hypothetical protein